MEPKLTGIPETMLIPLWARATETGRADAIVQDQKAAGVLARIDYDFSKFEKAWLTQVGVCIRTMLFDEAVGGFLTRAPGAIVVNLGAGLDTRYQRLKQHDLTAWYDVDLPEAIELRRQFMAEDERNHYIAKSVFDFSWLDEVSQGGRPILLIAEGLLMYFPEDELKPFFRRLAADLSGAEMLFEMLAPALVGKSKRHDSLKRMQDAPEFKWSLKHAKKIEAWDRGITYLGEWNYYDYHPERWKWFGRVARIPLLKSRLSNRIVHLRFGPRAQAQ